MFNTYLSQQSKSCFTISPHPGKTRVREILFMPGWTPPAIQHLAAVLGYFYPCIGSAILECIMNTCEGGESVRGSLFYQPFSCSSITWLSRLQKYILKEGLPCNSYLNLKSYHSSIMCFLRRSVDNTVNIIH